MLSSLSLRFPALAFLVAIVSCAIPFPATAQTQVETHPCTQKGTDYSCDQKNFAQVLQATRTATVDAQRLEPASVEKLQSMLRGLGKTVQPAPADLTFVLTRTESDGVYIGAADRELASLKVYYTAGLNDLTGAHAVATRSDAPRLLWVESYSGQPDTQWQTVVHNLTDQFRKEFQRKNSR